MASATDGHLDFAPMQSFQRHCPVPGPPPQAPPGSSARGWRQPVGHRDIFLDMVDGTLTAGIGSGDAPGRRPCVL